MRNFNFSAIKDLWEDYRSSFIESTINLKKAKICRVDKINSTNDGLEITVIDVMSGKKYKGSVNNLPRKLCNVMERIGCFYEIDNRRYIPTNDVKGRIINDYCKPLLNEKDTSSIILNKFSEDSEYLRMAKRFESAKSLNFISRRPITVIDNCKNYKYLSLVGIKSSSIQKRVYAINIIGALDYNMTFRSSYTEQDKRNGMNFTFTCDIAGGNLLLKVNDNITGRRAIRIDIAANADGREYVLESIELNHRNKRDAKDIAKDISKKIDGYKSKGLNLSLSADDVEAACLKCIPIKSRKEFQKEIRKEGISPAAAAYDIIESGYIFNMRGKAHKTKEYDGGKKKAEVALGQAILKDKIANA